MKLIIKGLLIAWLLALAILTFSCSGLQPVNYAGKLYTAQYIETFTGNEGISIGLTESELFELMRDKDVYVVEVTEEL